MSSFVRRRWRLAVAVPVVLGLLAVWVGVPWFVGRPWGGRIADRDQRVSIVIPRGWTNATSDEAGRISTDDGSGGETDPYRVPDLSAYPWPRDQDLPGPQNIDIVIVPAADTFLEQLHADHKAVICAEIAKCDYGWRPAEPVQVDRHQAITQFLLPAATAQVVWAVTVIDGQWVVRFTGTSTDWRDSKDGGQLATVLHTLRMPA